MRNLILERVEQIKEREQDFPRDTIRWKNYLVKGVHISEAGFVNLKDESLLEEFERLVKQINKQM